MLYLKRVAAVVKYLAIRGLAFRGTEEVFGSPHNGNFMGALELLAEFDPFIREHIEQRELRQKSLISFLLKTIWSCHYDAVEALKGNYGNILKILKISSDNEDEKTDSQKDAVNLFNTLT
ncbi:zinc finger MYM-type protein 1 [Trichonephila clavipes]|nr:zinc finger MYM-type protein 1 [Trichonephila clavipes]